VAELVEALHCELVGRGFDALWPPPRRRAVMWILANVVHFRIRPNRNPAQYDFIGFMQANKYRLYKSVKRRILVANYLSVLERS
jgi:hypothetical protein